MFRRGRCTPRSSPPSTASTQRSSTAMTYELISAERKGRVGIVKLNRPKQMNALNAKLMQERAAALYEFDGDEGIGAIVLTGSDKAFAAGADIAAMKDFGYMDAYLTDYITRDC